MESRLAVKTSQQSTEIQLNKLNRQLQQLENDEIDIRKRMKEIGNETNETRLCFLFI